MGTAEQGGFHVVQVHGVLGVPGAQNQVLKSVFSQDGCARFGVEDVARFGVDLGDAVVKEIHGLAAHPVPSAVPDVASAALPLLHTRPNHAVGIHIDGVVEAQAVLPPQEVGVGVKPEQGTAVGDEGNDRRVGQHQGVMDAPVRLHRNLSGDHPLMLVSPVRRLRKSMVRPPSSLL